MGRVSYFKIYSKSYLLNCHNIIIVSMKLILNLFLQPFPAPCSPSRNLRTGVIAGVIVFFIMFFLQPFGFHDVPQSLVFAHSFFYALLTCTIVLVNFGGLPVILPKLFIEHRWTLAHEFLMTAWLIFTIGVCNGLLTHFLYGAVVSTRLILHFLSYTAIVGIFPASILILLKYIRLLKKYNYEAQLIQPISVAADESLNKLPCFLTLKGDNQNEVLQLLKDDFLYISAADNYIEVFYLKDGQPKSSLLRGTLKAAEETLIGTPGLFRCHRAYLVNLEKVKHISGNAQGLKLHLTGSEVIIPVSRNLTGQLKKLLGNS